MNTSVIAQPLSPGIISVDMAGQVFTHELRPPPLSPADNARVLDLASPLYNPGATIDGVSKVYDRSGYGNHGTITGATWKQLPSGLSVITYDVGGELITVANSASLQLTNTFTFELWTYRTSRGENSTPYMISKNTLTDYGLIYWSDDSVRFYPGADTVAPTSTLLEDVWQYFVLTFDKDAGGAKELKGYLNGGEVGTSEKTEALPTSANDLIIGNRAANSRTFDGDLALVRISHVVLTPAVIASHFNEERHLFNV